MQMVAQRVVDSLEKSVRVPGPAKKRLAMEMVRDDLVKLGIVTPDRLIDTAIEVSVKLLKALEREALPFGAGQGSANGQTAERMLELRKSSVVSKVDVTGHPPNGNSGEGLSL